LFPQDISSANDLFRDHQARENKQHATIEKQGGCDRDVPGELERARNIQHPNSLIDYKAAPGMVGRIPDKMMVQSE
jgi:hypothetical protein